MIMSFFYYYIVLLAVASGIANQMLFINKWDTVLTYSRKRVSILLAD
jgi:hypothetical protein